MNQVVQVLTVRTDIVHLFRTGNVIIEGQDIREFLRCVEFSSNNKPVESAVIKLQIKMY
jgi:hypothetical protein